MRIFWYISQNSTKAHIWPFWPWKLPLKCTRLYSNLRTALGRPWKVTWCNTIGQHLQGPRPRNFRTYSLFSLNCPRIDQNSAELCGKNRGMEMSLFLYGNIVEMRETCSEETEAWKWVYFCTEIFYIPESRWGTVPEGFDASDQVPDGCWHGETRAHRRSEPCTLDENMEQGEVIGHRGCLIPSKGMVTEGA